MITKETVRDTVRRNRPLFSFAIFRVLPLALFVGGVFWIRSLTGPLPAPRYPRYEALMDAISRKDVQGIKAQLAQGINPNEYPSDYASEANEANISPLNSAASHGETEIVTILLDHEADPNITDQWSGALEAAAQGNHLATMRVLIAHGAVVNDSEIGSTALWEAAMSGNVEAVRYLLSLGASSKTLLTAMESLYEYPEIIAILRKAGAKD